MNHHDWTGLIAVVLISLFILAICYGLGCVLGDINAIP